MAATDDLEFFEEMVALHAGALLQYAIRRTASEQDAQDALSETFTIAWRRLLLGEVPRETALPWLYGVARRVIANQRRSATRLERLRARLTGEPRSTADEPQLHSGGRVITALSGLSEGDREIIRLAEWEQLSGPEIAQVLGCSPGLARLRLMRARKRLLAAYDDLPPDEGDDD